jgi:RNA polymerase sigma factor (sigma-70 family)
VESPTSLKKHWVLTQNAFDLLLARLDPDLERAGQHYENIRHALITFFECRGSACPEDHTDETINRVARRLLEGKEIQTENPATYFYGVARNVLKEYWDRPGRLVAPIESVPASRQASDDPGLLSEKQAERHLEEQRVDCLEHCLKALASRDHQLISEYYRGETGVKIQNRKLLAERLGIPLNALRIRALRIREKLEECVRQCLGSSADR